MIAGSGAPPETGGTGRPCGLGRVSYGCMRWMESAANPNSSVRTSRAGVGHVLAPNKWGRDWKRTRARVGALVAKIYEDLQQTWRGSVREFEISASAWFSSASAMFTGKVVAKSRQGSLREHFYDQCVARCVHLHLLISRVVMKLLTWFSCASLLVCSLLKRMIPYHRSVCW